MSAEEKREAWPSWKATGRTQTAEGCWRRSSGPGKVRPARPRSRALAYGEARSGGGKGQPGRSALTHQIWNLSSGPVAYCIFNLLLGTLPRLAEASLRTNADAATRSSSKSLILSNRASPATLKLRLASPRPSWSRAAPHSAGAIRQSRGGRQESACAAPEPAHAQGGRMTFRCPDSPSWVCAGSLEWK